MFLVAVLAYFNLKRVVVSGISMQPTFKSGQSVLVWTSVPRDSLKIGDVIVLDAQDGHDLIKRIVFIQNNEGTAPLPETVWTPGGPQPFRDLFTSYYDTTMRQGAVPPANDQRLLVMGDNYEQSEDSRDFGPIAPSQIIGKVIR